MKRGDTATGIQGRSLLWPYGEALNRFFEKHPLLVREETTFQEYHDRHPEEFSRLVYLTIKFTQKWIRENGRNKGVLKRQEVEQRYSILSNTVYALSALTPRELIQQYPITKTYDGKRWGVKDYFYTMQQLADLDMDKPIAEQSDVLEIFMEYQNPDMDFLVIESMSALSDIRRLEGSPGIMEEFLKEQGVTPWYLCEKEGYLYNPETGKSVSVQKAKRRRPKWWKVLNGKRQC